MMMFSVKKIAGGCSALYEIYRQCSDNGISISTAVEAYKKFSDNNVSWDEVCEVFKKVKDNNITWDDVSKFYNRVMQNKSVLDEIIKLVSSKKVVTFAKAQTIQEETQQAFENYERCFRQLSKEERREFNIKMTIMTNKDFEDKFFERK